MLNATSLSIGGVANVDNKTDAARSSLSTTYNQFLSLLTTQLKNQDPLNPMDSKDFTNQLINMANTEQQIAQTAKMDDLIKLNQATAANQALNYIGLNVGYAGNNVSFDGTNGVMMKYTFPEAAQQGALSIQDKNGQTVWTSAADLAVGDHTITWDGKDNAGNLLPAGNYTLLVGAQNATGGTVKATTTVPGLVTGIETDADGQVLLTIGDQKVPISSVQSAFMRRAA